MDKDEKQISEKVVLVNHVDEAEDEIDLFNVFSIMSRRKKLIAYLLALAILIGSAAGVLYSGFEHLNGKGSYARAMVSFQFDGIEQGLDPNGASFDVTLLKSPYVIQRALNGIGGYDESYIENIRHNIVITGVVPEDALEKITAYETMAEKDAAQYEKILDVSYFPSQYIVYLYDDGTFSPKELTEILGEIISSYKQYFLETYANTNVLTVTSNLLSEDDYDYGESIDLVRTQIQIMLSYVAERQEEAPEFRSSNTGLSFEDIITALQFVQSVDLSRLASYVESQSLTKDKSRQIEYYQFMIREASNKISEYETQLESVEKTIASYEKDPVVIVSGADSTLEYGEKSEYYDSLVDQKIDLTKSIAETNTKLNEYYLKMNTLQENTAGGTQTEFEYADKILVKLDNTISSWVKLIEETTQEYYSTTLYSNAVKVAVSPQYFVDGGLGHIVKNVAIPVFALVALVLIWWFYRAFKEEVKISREREELEAQERRNRVG